MINQELNHKNKYKKKINEWRCYMDKEKYIPNNDSQHTKFPASNVPRFDGFHRDQAHGDKQLVDVEQESIAFKNKKSM